MLDFFSSSFFFCSCFNSHSFNRLSRLLRSGTQFRYVWHYLYCNSIQAGKIPSWDWFLHWCQKIKEVVFWFHLRWCDRSRKVISWRFVTSQCRVTQQSHQIFLFIELFALKIWKLDLLTSRCLKLGSHESHEKTVFKQPSSVNST